MKVFSRVITGISAISITACTSCSKVLYLDSKQEKVVKFSLAIDSIRKNQSEILERWVKDEESWRKLPARAWPAYQPKVEEIEELKVAMEQSCTRDEDDCLIAKFNIATAFAFNHINSDEAIKIYESLAVIGDPNSMTALGICFCEGFGVDFDFEQGVGWLRKAHSLKFAQATYELGSLYYTGSASPTITENSDMAFKLFELAANQNHTSAMFMVADMLMSDDVKEKDYATAVDLLYRAGDQGHRYARSMVWKLLREEESIKQEIMKL